MAARDRKQELRLLAWLLHAAGLLAVIATASFIYLASFRPLALEEQRCRQRINELRNDLRSITEVRAEYTRLVAGLADTAERTRAVHRRIPDEEGEAEFLGAISHIANREQVRIRDYQRGEVAAHNGCSRLSIHLTLEAGYDGLCGFLDGLAQLPRITSVTTLDVSATAADPAYPVDMTVVLYFGQVETSAAQASTRSPAANGEQSATTG